MLPRASFQRRHAETPSGRDGGFGGVKRASPNSVIPEPTLDKGRALEFWRLVPCSEAIGKQL